ncbi:MAG: hypothetical protein H7Y31_12480 [Chitinophagaceae bacterium]|nr:hypothetical protein [Chitinophagaceae bacterium]
MRLELIRVHSFFIEFLTVISDLSNISGDSPVAFIRAFLLSHFDHHKTLDHLSLTIKPF